EEIAPGIDLERDILSLMSFRPAISETLKTMDPTLFREEPMGSGHGKKLRRET
ncbi:MAG: propionate CoA-transferase, partial [Actinomycetota bacterium]|nr:propionate CoA-transferase [Actinomycetota bacterium]